MLLYSEQVPHNINFREKKSKLKKDKKVESGAAEESSAVKSRIARFRYFEDISGYSGVRRAFFKTCFRTQPPKSNRLRALASLSHTG